jgi:D-3-phosphoglycerate dehydrogenase
MSLAKNVKYVENIDDLIEASDYVTIHVPLNANTKGMINKNIFNKMKDGTILLNFSRDALVDDEQLKEAIDLGKVKKYVTDFANPKVVNFDNVICFPHLGASTEEAEDNCALMAIAELIDYIDNGNITNSVNYPTTNAGTKKGKKRICICHLNKPGMIAKFTQAISDQNGNIETLINNSKGNYAYTIIDVDNDVCVEGLKNFEDVLRIRVI